LYAEGLDLVNTSSKKRVTFLLFYSTFTNVFPQKFVLNVFYFFS